MNYTDRNTLSVAFPAVVFYGKGKDKVKFTLEQATK
jgi:hypothetical protein